MRGGLGRSSRPNFVVKIFSVRLGEKDKNELFDTDSVFGECGFC